MDEGGHFLVAAIGKAPAVVTECWGEMARSGIAVSRVVVLYTERVRQYFIILELDFKYGEYAGRVNIEGIQLPVKDVSSSESKTFGKILFQTVEQEAARSHLLFQGVRETMVVDVTLVALTCGLTELLYIGQPVGAAIDVEVIAEYYDLTSYRERKPTTELMDKTHAACHPHVKKPLLNNIALSVLDHPARQALPSWVLG